MPLGMRELLLVVRTRDVGSRVVRELATSFGAVTANMTEAEKAARKAQETALAHGAALTGIGVGIGAVGAAGLAFFNNATDSAIEYNRQAALTLTQVDQTGVKLRDIEDIGRRVAQAIPAPFDQMQAALFDIFSSMDIGTKDAEMLLRQFAKGAVAGQTDVQTAARSTISVMNAYGLPFSDANRIMDIMFEMVRKGVGTYEEFNSSIGRAIPAAVAASQEFETLAGVMAFLTRAGLSTDMAATSAARAMELFTKPDVTAKLREIGVETVDAAGNFRQLDEVLIALAGSKGWSEMGSAERKKLFEDIFGEGTIQARRFFDTAIPNFEQFASLVSITGDSSGELGKAYETMFNTPAMQAQLLSNQYEALKTEIGNELIPAKMRLIEVAMGVLKWFRDLDDSTKEWIVRVAAITAALTLLVGIGITVVGVITMLTAAAAIMSISIGSVLLIIGGVALAIAAVIAIGILLVKNWDTIKRWASNVWQFVQDAVQATWQGMQDFWDWLTSVAVGVWQDLSAAAIEVWDRIKVAALIAAEVIRAGLGTLWGWLQTAYAWLEEHFGAGIARIWDAIKNGVQGVASEVGPTIEAIIGFFQRMGNVTSNLVQIWVEHWKLAISIIVSVLTPVIQTLGHTFEAAFKLIIDAALFFWGTFQMVFSVIVAVAKQALEIFMALIEGVVGTVIAIWDNFGGVILDSVKSVWNLVTTVIASAITFVSNLIQLVMNIIQGDWGDAWNNIKNMFSAVWDALFEVARFGLNALKDFFFDIPRAIFGFLMDMVPVVFELGKDVFSAILEGAKTIATNFFDWIVNDLKDLLLSALDTALDWLYESGKSLIQGLINGAQDTLSAVWEFIQGVVDGVIGFFKDLFGIGSPSTVMAEIGGWIIEGLWNGIVAAWEAGLHFWADLQLFILNVFIDAISWLLDAGGKIIQGMWDGIQNIWDAGVHFWADLYGYIFNFFGDAINWLLDAGKNILQGLWDGIVYVWEGNVIFWTAAYDYILDFFSDAINWLVDSGKNILQGLWDGINAIWDQIVTWFVGAGGAGGVYNAFIGFFADAVNWLLQKGKDIISGLWEGMKNIWNDAIEWFKGIPNKIMDALGINSPPQWAIDSGKFIMEGLLEGVGVKAGELVSRLKDVAMQAALGLLDLEGSEEAGRFLMDKWGFDFTGAGAGAAVGRGLVGHAASAMNFFKALFPWMTIGGYRAVGSVPGSDHPKGKALDLMTTNGGVAAAIIGSFLRMPGAKYWIWNRRIASAANGWIPRPYYGPSPHTDHVHLSFFEQGAWKLLKNQLAFLHKGEMVVPAGPAEMIRRGWNSTTQTSQAPDNRGTGIFIENAYFGDSNVVQDLDWWARTHPTGV